MRILIIEDEAIAAEHLSDIITKLKPDWTILEIIPSVGEGLKWFEKNEGPDLIFSDIRLRDGLSFELFEKVNVSSPIIFTTAYDQYAIKAFEVTSVDYLLKPIQEDRVSEALHKMGEVSQAYRNEGNRVDIRRLLSLIEHQGKDYKSRFMVKKGTRIVSVKTAEIAYFSSEKKLTLLVTWEGQHFPVDFSLDELENLLNPSDFFRVNRQFLIHLDACREIKPYFKGRLKLELEPAAEGEVVISSEKSHLFKGWLDR